MSVETLKIPDYSRCPEAVRMTLAEDADDLRDSDQRQAELSAGFEEFVTSLRDSGRL